MKTGKRIVSIFLVVLMLLTAAPLAGFVGLNFPMLQFASMKAKAYESGVLTYKINENNEAIITGHIFEKPDYLVGALNIPDYIEDCPVVEIQYYAFKNCKNITSLTLPDTLKRIGIEAFVNCRGITALDLPKALEGIGSKAFSGTQIQRIFIPKTIKKLASEGLSLYQSPFSGDSLTSVVFEDGIETIPVIAFKGCTALSEVVIPESVKIIEGQAFQSCKSITEIELPKTITSIGSDAFRGTGISEIFLPKTIKTLGTAVIGTSPFNGVSLQKAVFEEGIETIPPFSFKGCTALTEIVLPQSVKTIEEQVFQSCKNLISISLPNNLTKIGSDAFRGSGITEIFLPKTITTLGTAVYNTSPFYGDTLTKAVFEDGIKTIPPFSFKGCTALTEIVLPQSVKTIEEQVFQSCKNLTSISLPDNLTTIGSAAFRGSGITEIILPKTITTLGTAVYSTSPFYNSSVEKVVFEKGISTIPNFAFNGASALKEIYVPVTVTKIQGKAFRNCDELTDVYYAGSEEEWNRISIGSNNDSLTNATIHYNYSGEGVYKPIALNKNELYLPLGACETLVATIYIEEATLSDLTWSSSDPTVATVDENGLVESLKEGITIIYAEIEKDNVIYWDECKVIVRSNEINYYSLGEETYSFKNFGGGQCFGMSSTSSMYYLELLDKSIIGDPSIPLYGYSRTKEVEAPIRHYQKIQGKTSRRVTVAGGFFYLHHNDFIHQLFGKEYDIDADWGEVTNYVKTHKYDNKGSLQIGFRATKLNSEGKVVSGGHAINFLRYEVVEGQERIYAYDNNFPDEETYFYKDLDGSIRQAPDATFSNSITCIALRDMEEYYELAKKFKKSRTIYAFAGLIDVQEAYESIMDGDVESVETVMYEFSDDATQVKIVPLVDNAEFTYMDQTYSFGEIDENTYGILTLSKSEDGVGELKIETEPHTHTYTAAVTTEPTCTTDGETTYTCSICGDTYTEPIPATGEHVDEDNDGYCDTCEEMMQGGQHCKYCGKIHDGLFGWLVKFFHSILAIFKR